jgi:ribosomal peptide maturation radical SAM protein 1
VGDARYRLPLLTGTSATRDARTAVPAGRQATLQLICMPFQHVTLSSLAVALLASTARDRGIDVTEAYLHFALARILGRKRYTQIAEGSTNAGMVGELLFAEEIHGTAGRPEVEERLAPIFGPPEGRARMRAEFLRECLVEVDHAQADLIGFSASCNQLLPSLWLAQHIKAVRPNARIVFGGSSCSEPMGTALLEGYPVVDHVVNGYGEEPLIDLCLGGESRNKRFITSERPIDMNTLPVPSYDRYLNALERSSLGVNNVMLAFESSRGCWWGQKTHCTFCGLNRLEIAYNSKSSERVVREVRELWDRYQTGLFATDSILSRAHLKEAIPVLASYETKPTIFYEVKANMTWNEVASLQRANVLWLQPGIESLSTPLLRLLKKGAKAIQNLALLKWCSELGIIVSWNLLCAIPGEKDDDYEAQIALMKRCVQLQPPHGVSPIRLDRYAPYFNQAAEHGWQDIEPFEEYRLLHPHLSKETLFDIAYHFEAVVPSVHLERYLERLEQAVAEWKAARDRGEGMFWDPRQGLVLIRDGEGTVIHSTPKLRAVIEASNEIISLPEVVAAAGGDAAFIDELVEMGVLYREGNNVLNVALCIDRAPAYAAAHDVLSAPVAPAPLCAPNAAPA